MGGEEGMQGGGRGEGEDAGRRRGGADKVQREWRGRESCTLSTFAVMMFDEANSQIYLYYNTYIHTYIT